MHISGQVARGGDEARLFLEPVAADLGALLHVQEAAGIGHVVQAFLVGAVALADPLGPVGDVAALDHVDVVLGFAIGRRGTTE